MKSYDFDRVIPRTESDSVKWNKASLKDMFGEEDLLPLWIADMDFYPPKEVIDAMKKRVDHGLFGYTLRTDSVAEAIKAWLNNHWKLELKIEDMVFTQGAVQAITQIIQIFTEEGDGVLIQPPVYYPFRMSIEENGRQVIKSPLLVSPEKVEIDFEALEDVIQKHRPKLMLLSNPHNPLSRVWRKEELQKLAEITNRYEVMVVSDELHGDLTFGSHEHYSWGRLDNARKDLYAILASPSKTFNLAGLAFTAVIMPDEQKRNAMAKHLEASRIHVEHPITLAAVEAAYLHGEPWLKAVKKYIYENYKYAKETLAKELPKAWVAPLQGTYLLWVNVKDYGAGKELGERLVKEAKLALDDGLWFGDEGVGGMRLNLACPRSIVEDAIKRLGSLF